MYSTTRVQIIEYIEKNGHASVKDLVQHLGITQAAVHRMLNKLVMDQLVFKKGNPPKVFYFLAKPISATSFLELQKNELSVLNESFVYISPVGQILTGEKGFLEWMHVTKNGQKPENCVRDYIKIFIEAQSHKKNNYQLIDATERFSKIFSENHLTKIFYHDFYSLIKFGKTKMGHYILHGKQSQNKKIIKQISEIIKPDILRLIKLEKIDAIAWTPHSLPRKIQFLKELEGLLKLEIPRIEIVKAYSGSIPIAQKSLSKIEERIQNARETMIIVPQKIKAKNILLIDDAVGSGATLNEISGKLKAKGGQNIVGFAIVGSYKEFEVIREI